MNLARSAETQTLVIGLAGGTGSGKTTVSEAVRRAAGPERVLILPQDAYYRAQSELPFAVRERTNYDEPSAFDTPLLIEQLDALLRGEAVARPVYDFARHDRAATTVHVTPRPVIVVEGILVLHDPALRERFTLRVFVDAPPDERFIRRLERDVRERGRSAQSVIEQYRRSVKPMHDLFVEPTKAHADLIIPEGGNNRVALEVLSAFVASFTERRSERATERRAGQREGAA
ncbi:uridine kinase [Truepera radiovictrix]|uniref:Uridine kinase n=1 Tax=Truepera radiovictrix (strain DSM 17093 / CIP 108686 / LMG 22925 / RQ-24) TaxID=649638 RepID=D7CQT5_TRURR|nr:uridine kinase [Truepera radiovictrix]ADI15069.1 uridine kinase [Truepera radiovictrix DSM 17093]WMT56378.1 uridine kinase [Truepera radiovictrix]